MKKIQLSFKRPTHSEVLIYDEVGSEFIVAALGGHFHRQVLKVRGRRINLSPRVVLQMCCLLLGRRGLSERRALISDPKLFMELAEIDSISPKVVVTFVDNSSRFNSLSRLYPRAFFLAVQNGFRGIEVADMAEYLNVTNLFCFGEDTRNRYQNSGCAVDNYIMGGSLKDGLYRERFPQEEKVEFDFCWISQFRPKRFSETLPGLAHNSITLLQFLYEYCKESGKSLAIAGSCKSNALTEEIEFLRKYIDLTRVTFVPNDPLGFSSYQVIDKSEVSVTVSSTIGFEAFSRGNKVLFCNFTDDPYYDVPGIAQQKPWIIRGPEITYSQFSMRLHDVHQKKREIWRCLTQIDAQKFVKTTQSLLPQEILRREITRAISGKMDAGTELE